jgi:hypothetical protein
MGSIGEKQETGNRKQEVGNRRKQQQQQRQRQQQKRIPFWDEKQESILEIYVDIGSGICGVRFFGDAEWQA